NEERCFGCHNPAKKINGIISVDVSLAPIRTRINEVHKVLLPSAALTVVAVFLAIWFSLSRTVTQPISLLIKGMRRTETGDFSARISLPRRDELGQLAERFNTMGEKLSSARRELEQYHQQQMMRAEKMVSLGQLASSIAHEIKNPLAGISGAMQVLAAEFPKEHPNQVIVKEIRGQVDRLNQVVQNLLDFAKPSQPRFVEADIHEILARVLFLVKQQARELGIELQEQFGQDLPSLWVDEKQIQQVFLNVSLNALQAMGSGGKLTIRTLSRTADRVAVEFQDTGPGIPPEILNTVFQPFFTTKPKGTGLGLAIAQRIMREHGGEIRILSEPGKGTCFILLFSTQRRNGRVSLERQEEWHAAL
ncbi:MAG: HAMP domain-containing protein, partial [Candidatus Tectomicrobia bacterium]|nr:HAMP domain-containing protein [Candidatus Tectomicrobia bacterium]